MGRRGMRAAAVAAALTLGLAATGQAAAAEAPPLRAGAGQADITPPKTGYYLGGWTRADRLAEGQSTRLYANALVLQRGPRKVALVAVELFAVFAGLQADVAKALAPLGYDREDVLLAASHTHSGPGGYANNPTYNTSAPSVETITDPTSFAELLDPKPADRQLYTFQVAQIAEAVRRADRDLAPAAAGWGRARLTDLTENRSIEAHLANHGIRVPTGQGRPEMDPEGVLGTIDPLVDVLRVDKVRRDGRRVPIGAWSSFADHGTVVKAETEAYSGDHHAAAWRVFAAEVRRIGRVPRGQAVVNVYPNGAEGDQTAGIRHTGPSGAMEVGTREAQAMLRAWRSAGRRLSRRPALDLRFTVTCFCGRDTATGAVAAEGKVGVGFLTGSEEGRGPLYDLTRVSFEGVMSPVELAPAQGNKLFAPIGSPPAAVPLAVLRVGDGAVLTFPGEATKEVGDRARAAVLGRLRASGVRRAVVAGLAYDFIQYIVTPEEYGQQSYEGASTLFGPNQATFLIERLVELSGALADGGPAPEPHPIDVAYGVTPDGRPYGGGAEAGRITAEPAASVARLGRVELRWQGGPDGTDRPVDRPFVTAERRLRGGWRAVESDLGLTFLWRTDAAGRYVAVWEPPVDAPLGTYRLRVTASRYVLESRPFALRPLALGVAVDGGRVRLGYPAADPATDLTARPAGPGRGSVRLLVDGRARVRAVRGGTVPLPVGSSVVLPAGGARDAHGNVNPTELRLR